MRKQFFDKLHLYWLKPGKDISDGLQYFKIEKDVLDMTSVAVEEIKVRVLVDHTIFGLI
jgi:hypothetical protein